MSSTGVYGTNFVQIIAAWILAIIFFCSIGKVHIGAFPEKNNAAEDSICYSVSMWNGIILLLSLSRADAGH
jgi:hypothetical protein